MGVGRPADTAMPGLPVLQGGPQHCAWNCALPSAARHQGCKVPECTHGSGPDHAATMRKLSVLVLGQHQ